MTIKRYDEGVCGPSQMFESENGDWCKAEEHDLAMAEAVALLQKWWQAKAGDETGMPFFETADFLTRSAPEQPSAMLSGVPATELMRELARRFL